MPGEKTTSDVPRTPTIPPKALPVKEVQGEKPAVKPGETQKALEKKDTKQQKTDIEVKKEAIGTSKIELQKKRNAAKEVAEGKKIYNDELNFLEGMDGPGLIPPRPDQKMVKTKDFERSQKELHEQEDRVADSLSQKHTAEIESVTKNGNLEGLDPSLQTKIHTEIIRAVIRPESLPYERKKEILGKMKGPEGKPVDIAKLIQESLTPEEKKALLENKKGPDGKPIDTSQLALKSLTPLQADFILKSDILQQDITTTLAEYKKAHEEAKKAGKTIDPVLAQKFQSQLGVSDMSSLELSLIRPGMSIQEYPSSSQLGIVQRVLSEKNFSDFQELLGKDLQWKHLPETIKRELLVDSFSYDPLKNSREFSQSLIEAKNAFSHLDTEKKPEESDAAYTDRIKKTTGFDTAGIGKIATLPELALEARKSGLSPQMRALADFFGPIGAALGLPFWKEYMGERMGGDDEIINNGADRWSENHNGKITKASTSVLKTHKNMLDTGKGFKLDSSKNYDAQAEEASKAILANKERYMKVSEKTGVPWELIGAIHYRESDLDFKACLHNGDKIIGKNLKTTSYPPGKGPFATWEESAIDALNAKGGLGMSQLTQSNQLEQVAAYAEKYNGRGYRDHGVTSAYVWSGTEAYTGGMYVADHVFSRTTKDPKPGVMPIIFKLIPDGIRKAERKPDVSSIASSVNAFSDEFQSSPFERSGSGTTLCSQTARLNLYKLLDRKEDIPQGNAADVYNIYRSGATFDGMVGGYNSSWSPPENANVADIFFKTSSPYGHRAVAYRGPQGWMILDPYYGGKGTKPQPLEQYPKKDAITGAAFYQKNFITQNNAPNQLPKSTPNLPGPVNPDSSSKMEGAKSDVFKTPGKVAFIGDSHFEETLRGKIAQPVTVLSGGNMLVGGRLSVYDRVDSPAGRKYLSNPDLENIVIGLGTNDGENEKLSPEQMVKNMQNLVNLVRSINPNCKILIVTPPYNGNPILDKKIGDYSKALVNSVLVGSGVTVADFYTESKKLSLTLADGTHLRNYQPMRQIINDKIGGNQALLASR